MKKLMSKLLAFALVATLAFALTGCFVTPNSAITFNKYPEATYVAGTSENSALSSIVVTLTENGTKVKEGNLADLEKEGVIVVEGFDLATEGANKTAKIIFGTAVVSFNYSVVAAAVEVTNEAELKTAIATNADMSVVVVKNDIVLSAPVEVTAKHIVLDLNGKTISTAFDNTDARAITVAEGAKLEIKGNGTLLNEAGIVAGLIKVYGEVVIHNGTFTDYGWNMESYKDNTQWSNGSMINVDGSLTIYNGTFNGKKHAEARDGIQYGRYLIYTRAAGTTKIYDGTFNHEAHVEKGGYALASQGTFFMYGGTVTSSRGALSAVGGTFDVRGGTFVSTAPAGASAYAFYVAGEQSNVSGIVSGGTFKTNSYALICVGNHNDGGNKEAAALRVTGGAFEVGESSSKMISISAELGDLELAGGTFNKKPEGAIAEGYAAVEENGVWTVKAI